MSLQSMITGANLPIGDPASLFKNPAQAGLDAFGVSQGGMGGLAAAMTFTDPFFDPSSVFGAMTTSTSAITSELTSKISDLGSQLPVAAAAAKVQEQVQSVDAILAATAANIPNQINNAFPGPATCPIDYVKDSFKSVTESNAIVEAGNSAVATNFNNTGAMSSLYTALNAIPGVNVTNGKELLTAINSGGLAVTAAVTAAVASSSALLTQLKSSFTSVETTAVTAMTSSFDSVVASSSAAINSAINTVKGGSVVGLINSKSPCIQSVMSSAVNPVKVDQTALSISGGVAGRSIALPGSESVMAANMTGPVDLNSQVNVPVVPAAQMIAPVDGPAIQRYTIIQLADFRDQVNTQNGVTDTFNKGAANFYKSSIEQWKVTSGYARKKTAAGATEENPFGTSTDPVALEEWRIIYNGTPDPDNWLYKRTKYNTEFAQPSQAARAKWDQMKSELSQRIMYGKYPYTYQIAQGIAIPEDKQYIWLDTTK